MTDQSDNVQVAVQYLTRALEIIDATRNREASQHVRLALRALRKGSSEKTG